ncbi:hypothetical protein CHS0354_026184 [Potamilus streckersoni]|uniref:Ig-like domain-containing protein n=1 Tax=Potamilus streckersoni TaxID=2493646 RepID=A0AAE0STY4_9BIVA|nr:hypothetical protein CHS0354_026184 [Potamilus streckersoni]
MIREDRCSEENKTLVEANKKLEEKEETQRLAADIVLTVNPTQVEAQRQEAIVLDCQGNTRNVSKYISKRVSWKHVANDGTTHMITIGFYPHNAADKTKYAIEHGNADNSDTNYSFKLKIFSIGDDDDGKYVCVNEDNNFTLLSSKEVPFTVLSTYLETWVSINLDVFFPRLPG